MGRKRKPKIRWYDTLRRLPLQKPRDYWYKTMKKRDNAAKSTHKFDRYLGKPLFNVYVHVCKSKVSKRKLWVVKVTLEEYLNEPTKYSWKEKYLPPEEVQDRYRTRSEVGNYPKNF